jgi:DNA-binding GntR family transcriptional regulator
MAPPPSTRKPQRLSLADGVYDELMARLFDNTLEPGASLNIDALSRDLDVSQTPIREALARLESTGLVIRAALKGYRVAPVLSPKELGDLLDARAVLEPVNAGLAAANVTPSFLRDLTASIDQLAASPTGPSFAEYHAYWEADEQFHDLIARQADNVFLYRAFEALGGQAQRFRLFGGLGVSDAESAIAEHREIFEALEAEDAHRSQVAMERHVVNVKSRAVAAA